MHSASGPIGPAPMQGDHAGKRAALAENRIDDLAEIVLNGHGNDLVERAPKRPVAIGGGARHRRVECCALQPQGLRLIEHREMRRDLRLQREALQQPLAEAVDGVDLEAAFGFQRLSEEAPRRLHFRIAGGAAKQAASLARKSSSESVAQEASSPSSRFCISAAAILV